MLGRGRLRAVLAAGVAASPLPGPIGFSLDLGGFTLFSDPTPGGLGELPLDVIAGTSALPVPEPTSLGLLVAGSLAGGARWRNGNRAAAARA